jgi:hypothetical protein
MTAQPPDLESAPSEAPVIAFSETAGQPSRRRIALVVVGAVLLVVAAAATSMAASPSPAPSGSTNTTPNVAPGGGDMNGLPFLGRGRFGRGDVGGFAFRDITIASISGSDVTLVTADGWRRTITVSSAMNLTKGDQKIALGDLKVGDHVRFRQTRDANGTFTVTDLAVVVPTIRGTVSAVTSSGFKVTTRDGSVWTVSVNGSTKYSFGQGDGSLADVKDGTVVGVSGETTGDNAMTALGVRVAADHAVGTVTAKTADSITIKRRDGSSVTIHVSTDTTFRVAGKNDAKIADVAVDMAIGVSGRARADGSIDADAIVAGNLRGFRGGNNEKLPKLDVPGFFVPGLDGGDFPDGPSTDNGDTPSA